LLLSIHALTHYLITLQRGIVPMAIVLIIV